MSGKVSTLRHRHKRMIRRRIQRLEDRLADWKGGDPTATRDELDALRWALELMQATTVRREAVHREA
jgi:hypothetical protein